ncbi:unnamed protein product [Urochloa decumbens]|uniref:F-box domain-containing protein n=1 Tax=Urochloa decumbens TaxID=240449 RepID=A0ABC9B007_9POAL
MWSSLLTDLLVDIFRRLDASDLVRCTCTCKPWRHTIIGNVSSLRLRPFCFDPNLLLGFFHEYRHGGKIIDMHLRRVQGPFHSALRATSNGDGQEKLSSFIPADSAGGIDLSLYNIIMSSRDGFLLLDGTDRDDLCLCNPLTVSCTFLPYPAFIPDECVLVTAYDDSDGPADDGQGVRIVPMEGEKSTHGFLIVKSQLSTPTTASTNKAAAATWGPVKRSLECKKLLGSHMMFEGAPVVCNGAIHWLGALIDGNACVVAIDVHTGRTWTIEVPEESRYGYRDHVLAASRDGQITLARQSLFQDCTIHVWMLIDGEKWTLQRTIHVPNLNQLNQVFCPRSGWVLANVYCGQELVIDIQGGSSRPIMYPNDKDRVYCELHPYEMDWSTIFSRMKHF